MKVKEMGRTMNKWEESVKNGKKMNERGRNVKN